MHVRDRQRVVTLRPTRLSTAVALAFTGASLAAQAQTLPTGGQVSAGAAVISQPSAGAMLIKQTTDRTAINWQSFSIGAGGSVRFDQPSASSIALNRVLGNSRSEIYGNLSANGQVFLLNQNGVLFGRGAQVDVGGLVASTLNLSDRDFLEGKYVFSGPSNGSSVVNQGTITAGKGGYIALIGNKVVNEGQLYAHLGSIVLGAGGKAQLSLDDTKLIKFEITEGALNALAENGGLIRANGGQVILTAGAKESLLASTVNNTGIIEAQTVERHAGNILLLAGMEAGTTNVGGTLDASAPNGGDGGFIETSGAHVKVNEHARITAAAPQGKAGKWLVDPQDFTIAASGGDMTGTLIGSTLNGGTDVEILSSDGGTAGNGDIHVNDNVSWTQSTFTLTAARDININAVMAASGTAGLTMNTATANGSDGAVAGGTVKVGMNSSGFTGRVDYSASGPLTINGNVYTVIGDDVAALQAMSGNLGGYYALGANVDASATSGWNAGYGFAPVGTYSSPRFTGGFDGLGHTISGLTINRPAEGFVGLFGATYGGAAVRNVGLTNVSIVGNNHTGALVGLSGYGPNTASIVNSYATGSVSGVAVVGGLVGRNDGTLSGSFSAATVVLSGDYGGGLAGYVNPGALIDRSFATGSVSGNGGIGGFVGKNSGAISNSYAIGNVSGTSGNVGGLAGMSNNGGTITSSYATGTVNGPSNVGGLVGQNVDATVTTSYATGAVTGTGQFIGGLVGFNYHGGSTISNSYATGNVSGDTWTGGLAGYNNASITNSHATGNVSVTQYYGGGLVGGNYGAISNSYATGNVTGSSNLGGLLGWNNATISNSYASGNVASSGYIIGGLIGRNYGTITNSYATGNVTGANYVGGLVGFNDGSVSNSYSTGSVTGGGYTGGLMGVNAGTISNSYWDADTSGHPLNGIGAGDPSGATGLTTAQFLSQANLGGLDFGSTWFMIDGSTRPFLRSEHSTTIRNGHQLQLMAMNLGATYTLANNIDLTAELANPSGMWAVPTLGAASGFAPIGGNSVAFMGTFDGLGHTVNGLSMNRGGDYVGMFGLTYLATIRNVGLTNVNIARSDAGQNTGALVARTGASFLLGTTIDNSYVTGSVTSAGYAVGGLVGQNYGAITNSHSAATVSGSQNTGGLVGKNQDAGVISDSYASGTVSGVTQTGGLVGANRGTINGSFASGTVTGVGGGNYTGGLVGRNYGTISNSHATGAVTGAVDQYHTGGLVGRNAGTITGSYAGTGAVTGHYYVGGLVGYTYGSIGDSYATGNVTGFQSVGGLAGGNGGIISNSYASGSVIATDTSAGGIVGRNYGSVSSSYFTGTLSAPGSDRGPLVGYNGGTVSNSRYDIEAVTVNSAHVVAEGGLYASQFLDWLNKPNHLLDIADYPGTLALNSGTYWISNTQGMKDLLGFVDNSSYKFFLSTDVSVPTGYYVPKFSALEFDGGGRIVSGLNVNLPSTDNVGLFGQLASGSTIANLAVSGSVTGRNNVGGLVGLNRGTIAGSVAHVAVTGQGSVGGLVGYNYGSISQSSATGSVGGSYGVGGLVGRNNYNGATISTSFATGTVTGTTSGYGSTEVGGLVGYNDGTVTDSYSTGNVSGVNSAGGLVGRNGSSGALVNSHYDGDAVLINGSLAVTEGALLGGQFQIWLPHFSLDISQFFASSGGYYLISDMQDMRDLLGFADNASYKFRLTQDITLNTGFFVPKFAGNQFDGAGHVINGLNVNLPTVSEVGLFGRVESGSAITGLGVSGATVTGRDYVGGLVGYNRGSISTSYVTGSVINGNYAVGGLVGSNRGAISGSRATSTTVTGSYGAIGGLVGYNNNGATIGTSFVTGGVVNGDNTTGGLVGYNYGGTISGSYVSGSGVNSSGSGDAGPFIGYNGGTVTNSRFDIDTVTLNGSAVVAEFGLYGGQFLDWKTNGSLDIANYTGTLTPGAGGFFEISSLQGMKDLLGFSDNATYKFRLTQDISLVPGFYVPKFAGLAFDGANHVVTNLNVNLPSASDVGLFGVVTSGSAISNIGVSGSVVGGQNVGGLAGRNYGTVTNSHASVNVSGQYTTGGLFGRNDGAVSNSYATGSVTGTGSSNYGLGGLAGRNYGTISNSYAIGNVTGSVGDGRYFGGLVGRNQGDNVAQGAISGSHATGSVTGGRYYTGGLVGYSNYASISNSYATGNVAGHQQVGGLVGNINGSISSSYATGSSVTGTGDSVGGLAGGINGSVSDSYSTGNTSGRSYVGGLVGSIDNGTISNSYALGNVTSSVDFTGGLAGRNNATISNSFAAGSVSGNSFAGGLVGRNYGNISGSHATGGVTGVDRVGGLVGQSYYGPISNSYATGSVAGSNYVGGLVGDKWQASLTNSYATGDVSGNSFVGGLAGRNASVIDTVYASGIVTAGGVSVGGLVGHNIGSVNAGYYLDVNGTGSGNSSGTALSAAEIRDASSFSGFTFTTTAGATGNNWVIVNGDGSLNTNGAGGGTTPMLASEYSTTISNAHQLQLMAMDLAASYTLSGNIDASRTASGGSDVWGSGGFVPIGNYGSNFTGSLDGGLGLGRTISNLTINRPAQPAVGLFGVTSSGATISNVGLVGGSVSGSTYVGALVGLNYGSINNSYATGDVGGDRSVGGLVGANYGGAISNSYASGNVTGASLYIGGLVGRSYYGAISDSYATGGVSGDVHVGGLVGGNAGGSIDNSYATGAVSGNGYMGGLVGSNYGGTIGNSHATGGVSTSGGAAGGLVGFNYQGAINSSYASGNVSANEFAGGLVGVMLSGAVNDSYATGSVSGVNTVGGLVGGNYGGTISNSYATGTVSGQFSVGGLVGFSYGAISNSYATGSVSGHRRTGGLVGINDGGTINNSYATGSVSGDVGSTNIGGLVGANYGAVSTSYSNGSVSGSSDVGGLVGFNDSVAGGTVMNSYWNLQTSGQATSAGGMGLTTLQMNQMSSFVGFDFTTAWGINEGLTPPFLSFFGNPFVPSPTPTQFSLPPSPPPSDDSLTRDTGARGAIISAQQTGSGQGRFGGFNLGGQGGGGGAGGGGGGSLFGGGGGPTMNLPDGVE